MTTSTLTLADFLIARIAEDEAAVEGFHQGSDPEFFWGPARILAECEAKRRIVEDCYVADSIEDDLAVVMERDRATPYVGERILRALALPYADHADYREEWKP